MQKPSLIPKNHQKDYGGASDAQVNEVSYRQMEQPVSQQWKIWGIQRKLPKK